MTVVDIAVLGGGRAGCAAAARAAVQGASTVLLDEPPPADPCLWSTPRDGTRVWGVAHDGDGFRLDGIGPAEPVLVRARALIVCAGAHACAMPAAHLAPATEATRLLGAEHHFVPARGGWVPVLDAAQRTSVARLYAAGDCAGTGGDAAREGEVAAHAALVDLGVSTVSAPTAGGRRDQTALWDSFASACAGMAESALVCACEGVTRAAVEAAIAAGARDVNQLKSFSRAGMGPCQGRLCAAALGELVALRTGSRPACATARLPLRPVPMASLLGDFDYADIPVPPPAPA